MSEYDLNSPKLREEMARVSGEKAEPIVKNPAKKEKRNKLGEVTSNVISDGVMYVLLPAFKKTLFDILKNILDAVIPGEVKRDSRERDRESYRDYYENRRSPDYGYSSRKRSVYEYEDVIIDTKEEAEDVLAEMDRYIATYRTVTVGYFYELVRIEPNSTDYKYGWHDIRDAYVYRHKDGYSINFPKARFLD